MSKRRKLNNGRSQGLRQEPDCLSHEKKPCKLDLVEPVAIEQSSTISEVLELSGVGKDALNEWNLVNLDMLPNLRHSKPMPKRQHTQWQYVQKEKATQALPPIDKILSKFNAKTQSTDFNPALAKAFVGNKVVKLSVHQWDEWSKDLLEGRSATTKVFDMPPAQLISQRSMSTMKREHDSLVTRSYDSPIETGIEQLPPTLIISPALAKTEMHHDSNPGVATAMGASTAKNKASKLWIVFSSTEARHLPRNYNNTKTALEVMDHGCFFVQMPGDSLLVPSNSPHSVFTLETCYLYNTDFDPCTATDGPCGVDVDVAAGLVWKESSKRRVKKLEDGLKSEKFRQAYIDHAMDAWRAEALTFKFHENLAQYEELLKVWTQDIAQHKACAWCKALGVRESKLWMELENTEHIKHHLDGSVPELGRRSKRQGVIRKIDREASDTGVVRGGS